MECFWQKRYEACDIVTFNCLEIITIFRFPYNWHFCQLFIIVYVSTAYEISSYNFRHFSPKWCLLSLPNQRNASFWLKTNSYTSGTHRSDLNEVWYKWNASFWLKTKPNTSGTHRSDLTLSVPSVSFLTLCKSCGPIAISSLVMSCDYAIQSDSFPSHHSR